jgi:hypothetical protein
MIPRLAMAGIQWYQSIRKPTPTLKFSLFRPALTGIDWQRQALF